MEVKNEDSYGEGEFSMAYSFRSIVSAVRNPKSLMIYMANRARYSGLHFPMWTSNTDCFEIFNFGDFLRAFFGGGGVENGGILLFVP